VEGTHDGAAVREVDRILGMSVSSLSRLQHPPQCERSLRGVRKEPHPIGRKRGSFAHPSLRRPENGFDAAGTAASVIGIKTFRCASVAQCWLDDQNVIDLFNKHRYPSIRDEMEESHPVAALHVWRNLSLLIQAPVTQNILTRSARGPLDIFPPPRIRNPTKS